MAREEMWVPSQDIVLWGHRSLDETFGCLDEKLYFVATIQIAIHAIVKCLRVLSDNQK